MAKESIGVIIPSRGLVHSRTIEGVLANLKGYDYKLYFSHSLPIPDSFNELTDQALKDGHTHLWYVEEDIVPGIDTLNKLLTKDAEYVAADYFLENGVRTAKIEEGRVRFTGTGCTLIRRNVFDKLPKPYFRTDMVLVKQGGEEKFLQDKRPGYGRQDIYLGIQLEKLGIKLHLIDHMVGHLRIKERGESHSNNGCHDIYFLDGNDSNTNQK